MKHISGRIGDDRLRLVKKMVGVRTNQDLIVHLIEDRIAENHKIQDLQLKLDFYKREINKLKACHTNNVD